VFDSSHDLFSEVIQRNQSGYQPYFQDMKNMDC